jgi:hypothetical protein
MKILKLSDKTYKLADFDQKMAAELVAWSKTKLPDPLDDIKDRIKEFPPRLQELMVREAMQAKRLPKSALKK